METEAIKKISASNFSSRNLIETKKKLKNYEISFGQYQVSELRKAIIVDKNPFFIPGHFIVGSEPGTNSFYNDKGDKIEIERPLEAIIVEAERQTGTSLTKTDPYAGGDSFVIEGRNEWDSLPAEYSVLKGLTVGEAFLPPHSVVFNTLNPGEVEKKEKIVSCLSGVNINMYSPGNFLGNAFHEIGHLFWRTCVRADEKQRFIDMFKDLKMSALYEFEWERSDPEEFFCTIYKWFMKSILLNKSFYNILEHEEPRGLALFQSVLDRISNDKIINATWEINQKAIDRYFNPMFDKNSNRYIRKIEDIETVKETIIPNNVLSRVTKLSKGIEYIDIKDTAVPIDGNKILLKIPMQKAKSRPVIFVDMDGVVADFRKGYKDSFGRSADSDDPFTIKQFVLTKPNFFYSLPVLEKGAELVEMLKEKYDIVFLTTPMDEAEECRRNKINWIKDNFGEGFDVIFSDKKYTNVVDEKSVLIDDMEKNLGPWADAGGTAINIKLNNKKILEKIDQVMNPGEDLKKQLDNMNVNTSPTEAQKESGNYKKGNITFKNMNIRIENPKGSLRFGFDENGRKWITKMKSHYGYITGTEGADFDPVDCFIGDTNGSLAFVVNQVNPVSGMFDEHKIMLGFGSLEEAEQAYLANYAKDWKGLDSIKQTNTKKLRDWLKSGNLQDPF